MKKIDKYGPIIFVETALIELCLIALFACLGLLYATIITIIVSVLIQGTVCLMKLMEDM